MSEVSKDIEKAAVPSNVPLGELSTTGLRVSDGVIYEESDSKFVWPTLVSTCKVMSRDETIYAANNAIKALIRRVRWKVDTPEAAGEKTEQMIEREKFIWSCMHDMEHSWSDFINEALSMMTYGFSLHEKVYKVRRGNSPKLKYKSRYEDQKIGWAKLPSRGQDTVYKWHFDDNYRDLVAVEQDLSFLVSKSGNPPKLNHKVKIPINKLLHFKFDSQKGNPEGETPLKACYVPWKYKITIAEFEAIGVSR